ncbi:MAG: hypothetical protein LBS79_03330 [Tannerella sp.]|nr:hypothetical protein [Tannerella sp.]
MPCVCLSYFKTSIRTNVTLEEAGMSQCSIFDLDQRCAGAIDYMNVCKEMAHLQKYPITARSLERFFHVKEDEFERQYKEHLRGYWSWEQLSHAQEWLLFPEKYQTGNITCT